MIRPDQIPDEVANVVMHCFHTRNSAKSAIAAAINAWPDSIVASSVKNLFPNCVVLPIPEGDA